MGLHSMQRANKRRRLIHQNGHACHYCKKDFVSKDLTFDHVIPKAWGGGNEDGNIVLSCAPCNHLRGRLLEDLTRIIKRKKIEKIMEYFYDSKPLSQKLGDLLS